MVTVANNQKLHSEGHGDVQLLLKMRKPSLLVLLHNQTKKISEVIYVPRLSENLMSVGKIAREYK